MARAGRSGWLPSNECLGEANILVGRFVTTRERIAAIEDGPPPQDTTELSWQRDSAQAIGVLARTHSGCDAAGRVRHHAVCCLLMHSSLAVTVKGLEAKH